MTSLFDSRSVYFQDHRRCYWCNNLIKITEEYDYVTVGPEYLKIYFCEKCIETHPEEYQEQLRK